ncbi:MAG: hypothetical protein CMO34_00370 [Verrucomicrobia bacterium]|nr:hypothetical protein [Verrucomicrobiota bacterium]|tara:strand:+ start:1110 stop:1985 length:876 start_codon:yes stop_codon:yes gene_type:complete
MIFLLLSIVCSSAIFLLFKSFEKFKVNTFVAIVVNYLTAGLTGFLLVDQPTEIMHHIVEAPWLLNASVLGVIFISLFNIMALTAQKMGASVASISNKMALIFPVIFAFFYYDESLGFIKLIGIALTLLGIYLSVLKPKAQKKYFDKKLFFLPLIVFLGSGFIDTFIKFNQDHYLKEDLIDVQLFTATIFFTSFIIGLLVILFKSNYRKISLREVFSGILLGIINFGSIYFLIETFNRFGLDSSVVFPINNVGVVVLTTAASLLIFKERFSVVNKIGVSISVMAILIISFSV